MSNWTPKEKSTGELSVTIEGEEWKKACEKAFRKIAESITVKGFRKGQAPKSILDQKVPAQDREIEAIQDNANLWLQKGLEEQKLEPISRPEMKIDTVNEEKAVIIYTFAVQPHVTLGQYKGLNYPQEDVAVSDEEFEKELNRIRETYADLETKEGPAEKGDTVNINYEGFKDGIAFEGGKGENYNLELGSGSFIPGFEDQLIGCSAGDEKDVNVTFPEDYHEESLKGASVVFKVKVNEVKKKTLPEVDDDFAKDVNVPGVETADDLKKKIRSNLEDSKKNAAEEKADSILLDKVSSNSEVEVPDVLVEEEVTNMVNDLSQKVSQYGMNIKQYLQMMGKTTEDIRKDYETDAVKTVKLRMVLEEIARQEKLEPKEEELNAEYQKIADAYKMELEKVKSLIDPELLKKDIRNHLAYQLVKDNATKTAAQPEAETSETKE